MYTFTPDLLTGNTKIDTQHKALFDAINKLIQACMNFSATEEIQNTLNFLVSYTSRHFADEEALQKQYNYPGFPTHKLLHDKFKAEVARLAGQAKLKPKDMSILNQLTKTAGDWLLQHIKIEDVQVARYIKSMVHA